MATTKISQIIIRKGNLSNMKGLVLAPGEFMLMGDEQRLFLGQQPLEGNLESSGPTEANVSFTVTVGGNITPLFLNDLAEYKIVVTKASDSSFTEISSENVAVSDPDGKGGNHPIYTFNHGLGGTPDVADTFVLYYNKEVTTTPTDDRVKRNSTTFTNSGNAVETTGINFSSNVMNDIIMDYTLFDATHMRKGTLNILVNGNTTSSIEDKFIGDSELSDVEFSITNDGTGKFILNFKTSLTTGLQFNYTQTSSKFVTS
jgi:hypothetical protein